MCTLRPRKVKLEMPPSRAGRKKKNSFQLPVLFFAPELLFAPFFSVCWHIFPLCIVSAFLGNHIQIGPKEYFWMLDAKMEKVQLHLSCIGTLLQNTVLKLILAKSENNI